MVSCAQDLRACATQVRATSDHGPVHDALQARQCHAMKCEGTPTEATGVRVSGRASLRRSLPTVHVTAVDAGEDGSPSYFGMPVIPPIPLDPGVSRIKFFASVPRGVPLRVP